MEVPENPEIEIIAIIKPELPQNVISPKQFVLEHTFENVSNLEEGKYCLGPIEDHFGLNLSLFIARREGYLGLYLNEMNAPRQWHLNFEVRGRVFGRSEWELTGNRSIEDPPFQSVCWLELSKWESLSDAIVDDKLHVECGIRINEMRKIGKKVLRSFDASMKDVSDVVLILRTQKFYVSKFTLSAHSTYFKSLFLGSYKEANMPEITLKGIDPFDMQNYLEFLYHQPSISDDTVEGLLLLSDLYDTGILKEKCEDFLMKDSKKSMKKKFRMFLKYNCTMEKIVDKIIDRRDVKNILSGEDVAFSTVKTIDRCSSCPTNLAISCVLFLIRPCKMARGRKRVAKKPAPEPQVTSPEIQSVAVRAPESPPNRVSKLAEGECCKSPSENHFGLDMCLTISRCNGNLGLYLEEKKRTKQWHLSIEGRARIFGREEHDMVVSLGIKNPPFHSIGWEKLSEWESLPDFLVKNKLTVEFEVRINEMSKIGKNALRSFDADMEDVSDVVLVVRKQRFYVSKYTLSSHSTYFKSLLLGPYKESSMPEITLKGIDPFDMQNYLEFLYHQASISEDTVEGLLLLSDLYDTGILKEKCEDFLIKDSRKSMKKKFRMFLKYNCTMEKIVDKIIARRDVKNILAGEDVSGIDQTLLNKLTLKGVSF